MLNHRVRYGNGCFHKSHRHQNILVNINHSIVNQLQYFILQVLCSPALRLCLYNEHGASAFQCLQVNIYRLSATPLHRFFLRKEVIQPHLPIRLPCYDFTPVTNPAVVIALLAVRLTTSGRTRSHGVTGGVYKTRERIHRDILIHDY